MMRHPLESALGYNFTQAALLTQALTHRSLSANAPKSEPAAHNQRLEFLGDAVLGMVMAHWLYELFPEENEGALAKRHAALVCGAALVRVAEGIGLGAHLHLAASETAHGRNNASHLEDACEALIGALYLDGGLQAAEAFVRRYWQDVVQAEATPPQDAKTALQEWAQGRGLPLPEYRLLRQDGPSHAPHFVIGVAVPPHGVAEGAGSSKRQAEHAAAERLLAHVRSLPL